MRRWAWWGAMTVLVLGSWFGRSRDSGSQDAPRETVDELVPPSTTPLSEPVLPPRAAAPMAPEVEPPPVRVADTGPGLEDWEADFARRGEAWARECGAVNHAVFCEEGYCSLMLEVETQSPCPADDAPLGFEFYLVARMVADGDEVLFRPQYWSSIDPDAPEPTDLLDAWMMEEP